MKRLAVLIVVAALAAASCTSDTSDTTTSAGATTAATQPTSSAPPSTTAPTAATTTMTPDTEAGQAAQPRSVAAFADFSDVPLLDGGAYPGPDTPSDLDDVLVANALRGALEDPAVAGTLATNGFVIVPGFGALFHTSYEAAAYDPYPVFVTTDAAYHVWHLVFSKVLREMEEQVLLPILEDLIIELLADARAQADELEGSPLAEHAGRVVEWFQVAGALLDLDVGPLPARAAEELEMARDAAEMDASPVTSFGTCNIGASAAGCVDYTQFRPRGHYNRSESLQRYFRSMSLLGQSGFFLDQPDSLAMGVLIARLLDADEGLAADWARIYEPTAFLVGLADDYTPFEVVAAAAEVTPDGVRAPVELSDAAVLEEVAIRLLTMRPVGINPEAASMRVMGARFVIDSFIMDQMTWPNVGTEEDRRVTPSPLDVASAFGSGFAADVLEQTGSTDYLNYDAQLAAMVELLEARTPQDWAGTVYDAWLYALEPMWAPHGAEFPDFMRSEAWAAKAHQTGFGSYTELKHDTILYGKQGFAAEGGFEPLPFVPRHWVEPDPVAFQRISAVAALAQDGLDDRGLLPAELDQLLSDLREFVDTLARLAEDELAGRPISEEDNSWLESVGAWLEYLWLASADIDEDTGLPSSDDQEAAIVADIFRNTFAFLELGTGRIDSIYVLVPNDQGAFQVARGGVYSYYEFWQPAEAGRLTDEEWRDLLDQGAVPDRPAWQASFLPGAGGARTVDLPAPVGTIYGLAGGLFCRDLADFGFGFVDAVRYWWWDGSPDRMDADGNGIPCETVYPASAVGAFPADRLAGTTYAGLAPGLFCRDLEAKGMDYVDAFQYWLWDGLPDRMDADRNGIPCETVYDAAEVSDALVFEIGWSLTP